MMTLRTLFDPIKPKIKSAAPPATRDIIVHIFLPIRSIEKTQMSNMATCTTLVIEAARSD